MVKIFAFSSANSTNALPEGTYEILGLSGVFVKITGSDIILGYLEVAKDSFLINEEEVTSDSPILLEDGDVIANKDGISVLYVTSGSEGMPQLPAMATTKAITMPMPRLVAKAYVVMENDEGREVRTSFLFPKWLVALVLVLIALAIGGIGYGSYRLLAVDDAPTEKLAESEDEVTETIPEPKTEVKDEVIETKAKTDAKKEVTEENDEGSFFDWLLSFGWWSDDVETESETEPVAEAKPKIKAKAVAMSAIAGMASNGHLLAGEQTNGKSVRSTDKFVHTNVPVGEDTRFLLEVVVWIDEVDATTGEARYKGEPVVVSECFGIELTPGTDLLATNECPRRKVLALVAMPNTEE